MDKVTGANCGRYHVSRKAGKTLRTICEGIFLNAPYLANKVRMLCGVFAHFAASAVVVKWLFTARWQLGLQPFSVAGLLSTVGRN